MAMVASSEAKEAMEVLLSPPLQRGGPANGVMAGKSGGSESPSCIDLVDTSGGMGEWFKPSLSKSDVRETVP